MIYKSDKVLLYGYGNPARGDDGLGPELALAIEDLELPAVVVDANYQLAIEDAAEIGGYEAVVFADASTVDRAPFGFSAVDGSDSAHIGWSSHIITPAHLVALAHDLFGNRVNAYILAIRGYEFAELSENLSSIAKENLAAAVAFARKALVERRFSSYLRQFGPQSAGYAPGGSPWKA